LKTSKFVGKPFNDRMLKEELSKYERWDGMKKK
jgi:hypothetical protein